VFGAFTSVHFYLSAMALLLYLIIHKADKEECERLFAVQRRYVTPKMNYIGLRESLAGAVERRRKAWGEVEPERITDETHIGLKVIVTREGVADLVLRISAPEDHFASTLSKKVYFTDTKTDWKVWHFVGDLPLPGHELYNEKVYTAEWISLSSSCDS
jgi:hypothetical protein